MKLIALAGNPNSGKTTLFNSITGSKQHVGNWPGKTVEKKFGVIKKGEEEITIVDLPGTYSLTSFTEEEKITRDFIIKSKPDVVIDVIDATNLHRNLYLGVQLLELEANIVIVLNMVNITDRKGIQIDEERISEMLGVPVIKADVRKKEDALEIVTESLKTKYNGNKFHYGEELEEHIEDLENQVRQSLPDEKNPRWFSIKLIEQKYWNTQKFVCYNFID